MFQGCSKSEVTITPSHEDVLTISMQMNQFVHNICMMARMCTQHITCVCTVSTCKAFTVSSHACSHALTNLILPVSVGPSNTARIALHSTSVVIKLERVPVSCTQSH